LGVGGRCERQESGAGEEVAAGRAVLGHAAAIAMPSTLDIVHR
jgi:hypothetical protein